MILAVTCFENTDDRCIEEIMYGIQREVIKKMMDCAIILIIDTLLDSIRQCFGATEEQINELVCMFISKLPEAWRCRLTVRR